MADSEHLELIIRRFIEFERGIRFQVDRIREARLKSFHEKEVKNILVSALNDMKEKIVRVRRDIEEGLSSDMAEYLSTIYRGNLDILFYYIDNILYEEASQDIYNFLDIYLRKADLNDIAMVVVKGHMISCSPLNDYLEKNLQIQLPENAPRVWIITLPVRCELNPFEWPIILHEIGHIIEIEKYNSTKSLVKFVGYNIREDAAKLTNQKLFTTVEATRENCELKEGEFFWFDVVGSSVYDDELLLGVVDEIERIGVVDYLIVKTSEELVLKELPKKFYIPYIDVYIKSFDKDGKKIVTEGGLSLLEAS